MQPPNVSVAYHLLSKQMHLGLWPFVNSQEAQFTMDCKDCQHLVRLYKTNSKLAFDIDGLVDFDLAKLCKKIHQMIESCSVPLNPVDEAKNVSKLIKLVFVEHPPVDILCDDDFVNEVCCQDVVDVLIECVDECCIVAAVSIFIDVI